MQNQYLSFSKNFNAAQKEQLPSISFGFKPQTADGQSNLYASFEILTEGTEVPGDLIIEVVDKNLQTVADLSPFFVK